MQSTLQRTATQITTHCLSSLCPLRRLCKCCNPRNKTHNNTLCNMQFVLHVCVSARIRACMRVWMDVCVCACECVRLSASVSVYVYVCVFVGLFDSCAWEREIESLNTADMYLKIKLQHTATHCNTLQHTATHCNTGVFNPADSDLKSQIVHPRPANIRYSAASQRILFCKSFMGHVILQHTATNCTTLQHTCSFCTKKNTWKVVWGSFQTGGHFTLRHAGMHCNTYSAGAPCNRLQHIFSSFMKHSTFQVVCGSCDTAPYCNKSKPTATHMLLTNK